MLVELHSKGGNLCQHAKDGAIRCPLMVRPNSEDVVTGEIVQALRLIDPRHWLSDLLNQALGVNRFPRQIYRKFRMDPWVNKGVFPRELLHWDEGSTQVDLQVTWENPATTVFIEAKYGSKLSPTTSNNDGGIGYPGDQLIRNVRVGLQECGYYKVPQLFKFQPRDFVLIVLSPERRQPLVEEYRDERVLRNSIPRSELLETLPVLPFVGELGYADIHQVLEKRLRFMDHREQKIATQLQNYLELKFSQRPRTNLVPRESQ